MTLFGVSFRDVSLHEALKSRYVTTVNIELLMKAVCWRGGVPKHPELLRALCDGNIILSGSPCIEGTGAEMIPKLLNHLSEQEYSVFLFGSDVEVTTETKKELLKRYSGLNIIGTSSPSVHTKGLELEQSHLQDLVCIKEINHSGADALLLVLEPAKEQIWYHRVKDKLTVPLTIGIGAKKPTSWFSYLKFIWLKIFFHSKLEEIHQPNIPFLKISLANGSTRLAMGGAIDARQDLDAFYEANKEQLLARDLIIDFEKCEYIDSPVMSFLLKLRKVLREDEKKMSLENIPPTIDRILSVAQIKKTFN